MSVVQGSFTIHRVYDAPVETVFKAFAEPEAKARWFVGPDDWKAAIREQDFRVGGRERLKGIFPSGRTSDFRCEYRDIVPNERIVYVYDMFVDGTKISVSLAIVQFARDGKGTRLGVTEHGAFLDGYDDAGGREHGTGILLDQLGRALTSWRRAPLRRLHEAFSARALRDPSGIGRQAAPAYRAHADGMAERLEHRRVVLAVAQIADRVVVDMAEHAARHRELVEAADPAEQPQIVLGHAEAGIGERAQDRMLGLVVAGMREGKAGETERLVVGEDGPGHLAGDLAADLGQALALVAAVPEAAQHAAFAVAAEIEPAILADHAVDGPHPRHLIAPAGRRRGDDDDLQRRAPQPLQRRIGGDGQAAFMGERLVHVGQDETHALELAERRGRQPFHRARWNGLSPSTVTRYITRSFAGTSATV